MATTANKPEEKAERLEEGLQAPAETPKNPTTKMRKGTDVVYVPTAFVASFEADGYTKEDSK